MVGEGPLQTSRIAIYPKKAICGEITSLIVYSTFTVGPCLAVRRRECGLLWVIANR